MREMTSLKRVGEAMLRVSRRVGRAVTRRIEVKGVVWAVNC